MSVAIITGASSGIGAQFAKQIALSGEVSEVWLVARREERMREIAKELPVPSDIICADLSTAEGLEKINSELSVKKPNIKYLVNAAGYGLYGDYNTVTVDKAFNMIDLNIKALLYITQTSLPYMESGAHIIQMGSASTYNPLPNLNVYASTKAFVKHYSRALSYEVKKLGITVTTVCPGWVKTEFFDRANIDANSPNTFAKPAVQACDVVKKALKDAKRGKQVSVYALFNKTHNYLAKILPHKFIIFLWNNIQKK